MKLSFTRNYCFSLSTSKFHIYLMCDSPLLCNDLCNLLAISERKLLKVNP